MSNKLLKVKLKGNESFNFREGWLRKGMRCVEQYPDIFSRDDVMERLGVGSKMVKSIKFWLLATGLCEEKIEKSAHRFYLTKDFGKIVNEYDKYFDDITTLFFIHYKLVSNDNYCIVWNLFFNEYSGENFLKEDMVNACKEFLNMKMQEGATYSDSLFEDDCASVIRMYSTAINKDDPEESLGCPLSELGLLQKSVERKNAFIKSSPAKGTLDILVILFVMICNLPKEKTAVSIDDLLNAPNNIGRVFNLNRIQVNEYIDQLRAAGYITINRTAGLDMVYLEKMMAPEEVMRKYYISVQEM